MKPSRKSRQKALSIAAIRKAQRLELLAARGPYCQFPGCADPWSEVHEVLTRGRGGDPTDTENQLCLCSRCHRWVTTHEEGARALGLVRARTAEEHRARFRPWEEA